MIPLLYLLATFVAGALLPLAFAPVSWYFLAIVSPLLLLVVLRNTSPKESFWRGFAYGLGYFGFGAYWIFISIDTYGNTNAIISSIITGGFIAILALFPATMAYMYNKYFNKNLFAFACLWTLSEWIRSWFLTGFPWLLIGQGQTNSPLHGYAPVLGVYGITFLVVLTACLIYSKKLLNVIIAALIWLGGYGLTFVHWTHPISQPFSVTLIQGNIPLMTKWDPQQAYKSLKTYENLSTPHLDDSKIIVWPETAITFLLPEAIPHLEQFDKYLAQKNVAVISGIPIPEDDNYYNGSIVLGNGGGHYFKRHLVPFGEYVPFQRLLRGLIGFFNLPMSNFVEGPQAQQLMDMNDMYIAPFICYEIAYSHLLRTDLPLANVLVTMSNDSWFDQSEALSQHRQIAQLAAQMSQRYMLVATNSGQTVVIDPYGKILAKAPQNQTTYITATIQGMAGTTPWIIFGNWPTLILTLAGLLYVRMRR